MKNNPSQTNPSIIPLPKKINFQAGHFVLKESSEICCLSSGSQQMEDLLRGYLKPATGFELPTTTDSNAAIILEVEGEVEMDNNGFADESYELQISNTQIRIKAVCDWGLARGIQTFRQLFPSEIYSDQKQDIEWKLPCVSIADKPAMKWRGILLDVARHFFSVDEVCRFIELAAQHKLNILHLHLTDDQGWRLEIKKYPKLTDLGSRRKATLIGHHKNDKPRRYDDQEYGGFYTQEDIKSIVDFAYQRRMVVVPEIDMPGHSTAAIHAYPSLGNNPNHQLETKCHWGISNHTLNVEDETILFMKNVMDEVIEMFPGQYIHIGGDEAPKYEWTNSRRAQDRMVELNLKSEEELQSWFIQQIGDHILKRGKKYIGWDEILEGGLADGATVMSWTSEEGAVHAVKEGHNAILTPMQNLYFDFYQENPEKEALAFGSLITTEDVYNYPLFPEGLSKEEQKRILGTQCALWTEYIPTMERLEERTYPRSCAFSEVAWSFPTERDYDSFCSRLDMHIKRLRQQQVHFYNSY